MSAGFLFAMVTTTSRLRGRRWLALRAQVLSAEPRCSICLRRGRLRAATEVDHIVPLHLGGGNERSNLQPLCHDCHTDKSAAERGARRKLLIGVDGWPLLRQG